MALCPSAFAFFILFATKLSRRHGWSQRISRTQHLTSFRMAWTS